MSILLSKPARRASQGPRHSSKRACRVYEPPVWLSFELQFELVSRSGDLNDILDLGTEIWDASGGSEEGMNELLRFASKNHIVELGKVRGLWSSFAPPADISGKEYALPWEAQNPECFAMRCNCCRVVGYLSPREFGERVVGVEGGLPVGMCAGCQTVLSVARAALDC